MYKVLIAIDKAEQTSFGVLVDADDRLIASAFGPGQGTVEKYLTDYSRKITGQRPQRGKHYLAAEMVRLFQGERRSKAVKLNEEHVSHFQTQVCQVLKRIPRGKVTTYGLISGTIRSGPRAVGTGVASNPWPLFVACHRVVTHTLSTGNYSMCGNLGKNGTSTKRLLLEREGVPLSGDKIDSRALWNPSGE